MAPHEGAALHVHLNIVPPAHLYLESAAQCRAWALASLAPTKDMEVIVIGDSLECADFQLLLYVGLRALIDKLGAATFNMGIFNISVDATERESGEAAPLLARYLLTHWMCKLRCSSFLVTLHGTIERGLHLVYARLVKFCAA